MNIPNFSAHASLYSTSNRYHSAGDFGESIADESVFAAYIPGPNTQNRCSGCTDVCVFLRDACLAKAAWTVASYCGLTFGFGCAGAIALGAMEAASCEEHYLECFGLCNIPSVNIPDVGEVFRSPCCPKVCGIHTPGIAGSGCCDHGETCKGLGAQANTRDGCCPVGRDCGNVCCAEGEKCCGEICCPQDYYCLDSNTCSPYPGSFVNTYPTPPDTSGSGCYLFEGGSPCGNKCCYGGLKCCGTEANGQPKCRTSCGPN